MPLKSTAVTGDFARRVTVVLGLVCIFASSAFGQVIAPNKEVKRDIGKCIGVVSAIGDTLSVSKTGFTVFNNEDSKLSIDAWHIDDLVFSRISAHFGKRFNFKRVTVPGESFAALQGDHGLLHNSADNVKATLGKITAATKCDRYIVAMKTHINFEGGGRIDGLGIYTRGGRYSAYAEFTLDIYDGQNFSVLSEHPAWSGKKNFLGRNEKPYREADETWWPAAGGAQNPTLKEGFRALVEQSLDATVPELLND